MWEVGNKVLIKNLSGDAIKIQQTMR